MGCDDESYIGNTSIGGALASGGGFRLISHREPVTVQIPYDVEVPYTELVEVVKTQTVLDHGFDLGPVALTAYDFQLDSDKNVEILQGDLYKPVENMKFDAILCNPPVSAGMKIVSQIISEAIGYLRESGLFQIVIRSKVGSKQLPTIMEKTFGNVEIIARKSGYRVLLSKKS